MDEKKVDIAEQIDSIIVDCNNSVRSLTSGNYIAWCGEMFQITQKLFGLKNAVQMEISNRNKEIATLNTFIKDINNGGADNGTN